jgi:hypothetical protein
MTALQLFRGTFRMGCSNKLQQLTWVLLLCHATGVAFSVQVVQDLANHAGVHSNCPGGLHPTPRVVWPSISVFLSPEFAIV